MAGKLAGARAVIKDSGVSLECRECGGDCDTLGHYAVLQNVSHDGLFLRGLNMHRYVQLACKRCGHVRLFKEDLLFE